MLWDDHATTAAPAKTKPKVDRYAPCPCGSGKKYKFCCGAKGR
jgi:preprotein translocase subunit SecA